MCAFTLPLSLVTCHANPMLCVIRIACRTVTLANNATPGLYSCAPWLNPSMWLVWFYLFFIAASQARMNATQRAASQACNSMLCIHTCFHACSRRRYTCLRRCLSSTPRWSTRGLRSSTASVARPPSPCSRSPEKHAPSSTLPSSCRPMQARARRPSGCVGSNSSPIIVR